MAERVTAQYLYNYLIHKVLLLDINRQPLFLSHIFRGTVSALPGHSCRSKRNLGGSARTFRRRDRDVLGLNVESLKLALGEVRDVTRDVRFCQQA